MRKRQTIRKHKSKRAFLPSLRRKAYALLTSHPFAIPVFGILILFAIATIFFVGINATTAPPSGSHVVILNVDNKQRTVPTKAATVGEFLKKLAIAVNEGDVVEPDQDTPLTDDNFKVNVYRAKHVTIFDTTTRIQALSAATTPRSIAAQVGVTVYPEDDIHVELSENILKDKVLGEKLVIDRATPATIKLYGADIAVRSRAKTVGELLTEKGVKLASGDTISPNEETKISPSLVVQVIRNGTQIVAEEKEIPMQVEFIDDSSLSFGATAIRQRGSAGKRVITYELTLQNGKEVGRTVVQDIVATAPVKQIIARGQAYQIPADKSSLLSAAGVSLSDFPYVNYILGRESGWCATKWQGEVGYCPSYYEALHPVTSGYGFGLCQSTPAIKMADAGADWQTNPVTQLKWCTSYALSRYGSWQNAYYWWIAHNWW
jgi:resuscitation-promoting factor RpfB